MSLFQNSHHQHYEPPIQTQEDCDLVTQLTSDMARTQTRTRLTPTSLTLPLCPAGAGRHRADPQLLETAKPPRAQALPLMD